MGSGRVGLVDGDSEDEGMVEGNSGRTRPGGIGMVDGGSELVGEVDGGSEDEGINIFSETLTL